MYACHLLLGKGSIRLDVVVGLHMVVDEDEGLLSPPIWQRLIWMNISNFDQSFVVVSNHIHLLFQNIINVHGKCSTGVTIRKKENN